MTHPPEDAARTADQFAVRHLRIGWWSLLLFVIVGVVLELLHGFKVGFYLDVDTETRRLMWTLGHAHGTLLSIVHIAFAATVRAVPTWTAGRALAGKCLSGALVLLPVGFLLGGVWIHGGDPGLGVLLVPPGALLLIVTVFLTARGVSADRST